MEALEKQELCLTILEEIVNLRISFQATYESYNLCNKNLTVLWEKGLAAFLQEEYFTPIIEKYTKLYENNCAVYASLPLKMLINNTRVAFTTSAKMELVLDTRGYTPSAQVWCGMDRTKSKERDFSFPSRSIPLPVLYLQDPAADIIKVPSYYYNQCLIAPSSFFALLYLLRYGATKLQVGALPPISKALYLTARKLAMAAFKIPSKNKLEIPSPEVLTTKTWFGQMAKEIAKLDLETEKKKLNAKMNVSNFSQAIWQYLKIAKQIIPLLPPFPEKLNQCSFSPPEEFSGFSLNLDLDSACQFSYRRFIGEKNEGFYLKFGNNTSSLLEYPYAPENPFPGENSHYKSPAPSFEEELLVIYMVLISLLEEYGELEEIKTTLLEARKQYLNYIRACFTIKDAFITQMLLTKI